MTKNKDNLDHKLSEILGILEGLEMEQFVPLISQVLGNVFIAAIDSNHKKLSHVAEVISDIISPVLYYLHEKDGWEDDIGITKEFKKQ